MPQNLLLVYMQIICYTMTPYLAAYLGNTGSTQEKWAGRRLADIDASYE